MYERYSRQMLFSGIGREGQEKLLASRVLIVGCGALGAAHAETLARAGVGYLRLVDRDFVEFSNLQRQTLYKEQDAAERLPKAIAAKNRISEINSEAKVEALVEDVNHSNVEALLKGCDLVLDGTDNFQVRYLVNDACVKNSVNWIYGAAVSGYGTTMTIRPGVTQCLRCVFEEMPPVGSAPTCDTAGVVQPIISSISAIQTTEAIKILVGSFDALHGSLLQVDIWNNDWRKLRLSEPNEDCVTCGRHVFEYLDAESQEFAAILCGRDAIQIASANGGHIDLAALASRLSPLGEVKQNEYLVRFLVDSCEMTIFKDARAIIKGTDDISTAKSMYAKFIGI